VHDIFSPYDYPADWLTEQQYFWNEQYLLEAFLCHNSQWQILIAANYLMHEDAELLRTVCPFLDPERPPRSLYMRRRSTND
jgi:hypothetical protein